MPISTPSGVAKAKIVTSWRHNLKLFGKVFTSEMPRELPAAPLCTRIAITMLMTEASSYWRPRARPSKIECTDKAIMRINGVILGQQLPFFFYSIIEAFGSEESCIYPEFV